ncbi:aryl-alcohol dehydrogenase [Mycena vulgaris]|nr:aryl-alcohol dehydrogenase [Mycena vulgaris]
MVSPQKMPYVRLGNSDLKVSKIIFGCMSYEVLEQIEFAYDAGINAFDTAAVYSVRASKEILDKAIKEYNLPRDEIVVVTKVFGYTAWNKLKDDEPGAHTVNQKGLSRKHIFDSLDYIELLQCHCFEYETPIEETMQALHDVVQAGYVRYIGMSSCWVWQFHAMQNYAISNKLTPFVSMQNHHSLIYREEECHFGVGFIPWSPLARGMLTCPLAAQKETPRGTGDARVDKYNTIGGAADIVTRVEEVAKKRGVSMAQEGITAPIIGTTSIQKIPNCIAVVHLELTPEEMKFLEEPYLPSAVFGHT